MYLLILGRWYAFETNIDQPIGKCCKIYWKGSIHLDVTIEKTDDTHAVIRFAVTDTGIGILEKIKKYLRLSRKKTVLQPENLGYWLGLTISNQLLGLMNSRLQLESQIDVGNFLFWSRGTKKQWAKKR
jgi:signal transduction histidine kinase